MDKAIGTDNCDFLTAPEMDVDDFLALSSSRLDIYDLDSVSQISAMDSASQTGSVILESQASRPRYDFNNNNFWVKFITKFDILNKKFIGLYFE